VGDPYFGAPMKDVSAPISVKGRHWVTFALDREIDTLMNDSEIHVKAGDVLVQQGTNHAWVNNSGKNRRIAFVLIDAQLPAAWQQG
jgi:hypothetical protein